MRRALISSRQGGVVVVTHSPQHFVCLGLARSPRIYYWLVLREQTHLLLLSDVSLAPAFRSVFSRLAHSHAFRSAVYYQHTAPLIWCTWLSFSNVPKVAASKCDCRCNRTKCDVAVAIIADDRAVFISDSLTHSVTRLLSMQRRYNSKSQMASSERVYVLVLPRVCIRYIWWSCKSIHVTSRECGQVLLDLIISLTPIYTHASYIDFITLPLFISDLNWARIPNYAIGTTYLPYIPTRPQWRASRA